MKRYRRLLVPLGLAGRDKTAIRWAGRVSRLAGSEEVLFLHCCDVTEIPASVREKYPWLTQPLDEVLLRKMDETIEAGWDGPSGTRKLTSLVKKPNEVFAVLEACIEQSSDLVIAGIGSGRDPAVRLARKSPCSVMMVPEADETRLRRILVPTDFSRHAQHALEVAVAFASAEGNATIDSLNVYNLGSFSDRVALPEPEQLAVAKDYAEERHREFVDEIDAKGVQISCHNLNDLSVTSAVQRAVDEMAADLVVASCRGKDTLTPWLLGSNAEELLRHAPVPVIAVKEKGSGQKLLEALLFE